MSTPKEVAETIILQLGGYGKLRAMIGAKDFLFSATGGDTVLSFKFKGSNKYNLCKVKYNSGADDYDMTLQKFVVRDGMPKFTNEKTFSGVYCDQLIELFEKETGLYLSL
jgi:hypothetical protein